MASSICKICLGIVACLSSMRGEEAEIITLQQKIEALQPTIHDCILTQLQEADILAKSYTLLERLEMADPGLVGNFFTILKLRMGAQHVDHQVDMESVARLRGLEMYHKEHIARTNDLVRERRLLADIVEALCPLDLSSWVYSKSG